MKAITVAIDGFSSCGKSTIAKQLAQQVGYTYIDTGAMYRAVALYSLSHEDYLDHLEDIPLTGLGDSIRALEVGNRASVVATIPQVRRFLVDKQQEMGRQGGVVMDGRDIGTVVFPHAELKLFLTASPQVRAQRRYDELRAKGENPNFADVLADVNDRDYRDTHRQESPLRQADDAIVVDNSDMTREEQMEVILRLFRNCCNKQNQSADIN